MADTVMRLEYVRNGVPRVSNVIAWGAFPIPVPSRTSLVSPGAQGPALSLALSGWAMVAELDAARGAYVPVVVPIDDSCQLAGEYFIPGPGRCRDAD